MLHHTFKIFHIGNTICDWGGLEKAKVLRLLESMDFVKYFRVQDETTQKVWTGKEFLAQERGEA